MTPFEARAPSVMAGFMRDLGLTDVEAAGILGNLGQESGLEVVQERHPVAGRGGFGWPQWTGSRRVAYERYCHVQGIAETEPAANYGFMVLELRGAFAHALKQLRLCRTVEAATQTFETYYEMAGIVALGRRVAFAKEALALFHAHRDAAPMESHMTAETAPLAPAAAAAVPPVSIASGAGVGVNPTSAVVNAVCSRFVAAIWPELAQKVPLLNLVGEARATAFLEEEVGAAVNALIGQLWGQQAVAVPGAVPPAPGFSIASVLKFGFQLVENAVIHKSTPPA